MLEKGYKNRVVVIELAIRPSHMECLDILIVRVFKYGLIIEKQFTALNLVLQVYFEQPKFIGEATIIRIFIILFWFTITQRAFSYEEQIVCVSYIVEANLNFFIWHPYLYPLKSLLDAGIDNYEKVAEPSASYKGLFVSKCSEVFEYGLLFYLIIDITLNPVIGDIN